MNLSPQLRVAALVGVIAIVVLGGGVVFLGHRQSAPSTAASVSPQALIRRAQASHPAKPASPAFTRPASKVDAKPVAAPRTTSTTKPKFAFDEKLPDVLLSALEQHRLVVAVLYNPEAQDDVLALAEAEAGARDAAAGFVALDVLEQRDIAYITKRYGLIDDPAVLVFRRGIVIGRLEGFADRVTVAQAVDDAGL